MVGRFARCAAKVCACAACLAVAALLLLELLHGPGAWDLGGQQPRRQRALDIIRQAARQAYDTDGAAFRSLPDLVKSAYYPLKSGPASQALLQGVSLQLSGSDDGLVYEFYWNDRPSDHPVSRTYLEHSSPPERTRRLLLSLAGGPRRRQLAMRRTRQYVLGTLRFTGRQSPQRDGSVLELRPVPMHPISGDQPMTGRDLQQYAGWVAQTLGQTLLSDAWGQRLQYRMGTDGPVFRSKGADKRWGTADDIVVVGVAR